MKRMIPVLVLLLAVGVTAQTPTSQEDLRQTQDRLDRAIEGVKKGVDALVAQRIAADQANALRFQIKELEESKTQIVIRAADQNKTITGQSREIVELKKALAERDATIEGLSAEIVAIKKNIKRRALWRIFTFRW
jgi:chromosome segregation ATPase